MIDEDVPVSAQKLLIFTERLLGEVGEVEKALGKMRCELNILKKAASNMIERKKKDGTTA